MFMRKVVPMNLHYKCRNTCYPNTDIKRFTVPDDKVSWNVAWPEYQPREYTSQKILSKPPYADPIIEESGAIFKWNQIDDKINRKSFDGEYIIINGYPLNIRGRTGLKGRGNLGRWGPNHAADTILTRWNLVHPGQSHNQPSGSKKVETQNENITIPDIIKDIKKQNALFPDHQFNSPGKPKSILQFLAIERRDNGEWAFPGGMVDEGETPDLDTAPRELGEEILSLSFQKENKSPQVAAILKVLKEWFKDMAQIVYQGYVDDPRNTDNAWMESTAVNLHLSTVCPDLSALSRHPLKAGDDAKALRWIEIGPPWNSAHQLDNLYASHVDIVRAIAEKHGISTS